MEQNEQIPKEETAMEAPENKERVNPLQTIFEWLEIVVISFLIVLTVITFFVRHSPVNGSSMYPTLHDRDILLISNLFYTPERGDIVVVQDNGTTIGLAEPLVKRIIAIGGDTVDIDFDNWIITVTTAEGETIIYKDEPYVNYVTAPMKKSAFPMNYPLKVKEGYLFVMGDNRNGSSDSRDSRIGLLDERYVVGHVLFRLFPLNRIGSMLNS